jgi:hypothetical protein
MISTVAALLLLLAIALCLVLIPFLLWMIWRRSTVMRATLCLSARRGSRPLHRGGEIKEDETEQHCGFAAIGERIEALRRMGDEIGKGELAGEDEKRRSE